MSRALLLFLFDKANTGRGHCLPHLFSLMANHHEDPVSSRELERGPHYMLDQRFATGAVQNFRLPRFHARA